MNKSEPKLRQVKSWKLYHSTIISCTGTSKLTDAIDRGTQQTNLWWGEHGVMTHQSVGKMRKQDCVRNFGNQSLCSSHSRHVTNVTSRVRL